MYIMRDTENQLEPKNREPKSGEILMFVCLQKYASHVIPDSQIAIIVLVNDKQCFDTRKLTCTISTTIKLSDITALFDVILATKEHQNLTRLRLAVNKIKWKSILNTIFKSEMLSYSVLLDTTPLLRSTLGHSYVLLVRYCSGVIRGF